MNDIIDKATQHIMEGRFRDALLLTEQAIAMQPNDPDLWNCKGTALRGMGRYEEALACFDMSMKLDPRDRNSS